jgi:hypothetical protein
MFTEEELRLLLWVLEESERCDDGSGHWLPETFSKEMQQAISLVKREMKNGVVDK